MAGPNRNTFEFRRQAQRVFVDRASGDVVLRLHATDIVRVRPNGDVLLCTGGWATHKTLQSMNDALELFGMWVEATGNPPNGNWKVTDSDGTVHTYRSNTEEAFTIRAKSGSADDRQRAQWLAEAYEVTYNPPAAAAAQGPRVAAAPAGPRIAQPAAAAAANPAPRPAAQANGWGGAAAVAPAARPPGVGGSWANIAKSVTSQHQATTGPAAHAARVTGPGAAAAAGRVTGPGAASSSAAAAAGPSHRTTGPPGFGNSSGAGPSGLGYPGVPITQTNAGASTAATHAALPAAQTRGPATVTSAPPLPHSAGGGAHTQQLVQQMAQMGIGHDLEDDAQLCVVCMEEMRSIVLVPCGHLALCKDCCEHIIVQQQGQCPMCCQDVEYHVEVDQ